MPTPRASESKSTYMARCVPYVLKEAGTTGPEHAVAKCHGMWRQAQVQNVRAANPLRLDPTRTTLLRKAFETEVTRRFQIFIKEMEKYIVDANALDLRPVSHHPFLIGNATKWTAPSTPQQLEKFRTWVEGQVNQGILTTVDPTQPTWMDKYIHEAYEKGAGRSFDDYRKMYAASGASPDFYAGTKYEFLGAFRGPAAEERVKYLATRTFTDMKGVTAAMAQKMNRTLADGMIQGKSPREVAKLLSKDVNQIGITRARTVARTETIRAHAEGQLDSLERLGVEEVGVMVEWATVGDDLVCPLCLPMEGTVLKISEARSAIPRHPNCRCAWIPAGVGESSKRKVWYERDKHGQVKWQTIDQKTTAPSIRDAFKRSLFKEHPNAGSVMEARSRSRWAGADTKIAGTRPASVVGRILPSATQGPVLPPVAAPEVWGHQPTAVIRWMGQEGWSAKEAQQVLKAKGLDVSENTIKTQLSWGKLGKKPPAPLTPEQMTDLKLLRQQVKSGTKTFGQLGKEAAEEAAKKQAAQQAASATLKMQPGDVMTREKMKQELAEMSTKAGKTLTPAERQAHLEKWMMDNMTNHPVTFMEHGMAKNEVFTLVEFDGKKIYFTDIKVAAKSLDELVQGNIPKSMWDSFDHITFSTQKNKFDPYWAKKYKDPNFKSLATGGNGGVCVYNNSPIKVGSLNHELGHNLASKKWGVSSPPPTSSYGLAQKAEGAVSNYAKCSPAEDFAEACRMYANQVGTLDAAPIEGLVMKTPHEILAHQFPKKFDAIADMLGDAKKAAQVVKEFEAKQLAAKAGSQAAKKAAEEAAKKATAEALKVMDDLIAKAKQIVSETTDAGLKTKYEDVLKTLDYAKTQGGMKKFGAEALKQELDDTLAKIAEKKAAQAQAQAEWDLAQKEGGKLHKQVEGLVSGSTDAMAKEAYEELLEELEGMADDGYTKEGLEKITQKLNDLKAAESQMFKQASQFKMDMDDMGEFLSDELHQKVEFLVAESKGIQKDIYQSLLEQIEEGLDNTQLTGLKATIDDALQASGKLAKFEQSIGKTAEKTVEKVAEAADTLADELKWKLKRLQEAGDDTDQKFAQMVLEKLEKGGYGPESMKNVSETVEVKLQMYKQATGKTVGKAVDKAAETVAGLGPETKLQKLLPELEFEEHAATSIVQWMGKNQFSYDDAKKALYDMKITLKESTIKTQLQWGKSGKKAGANLNAAQEAALQQYKGTGTKDLTKIIKGAEEAQEKAVQKVLEKAAAAEEKAAAQVAGQTQVVEKTDLPKLFDLEKVKDLPGSTHPELMKEANTGKQWVMKSVERGVKPEHLRSEALADELYRRMGIKVPKSGIIETAEGPTKVSEFLDNGKTLGDWLSTATTAEREAMFAQLREGFVGDALLGNWDVAGLNMDNILVVGKTAYRIDNGGALLYRAQGVQKKSFGSVVEELKTLRDASTNPNTAKIFGSITDDQINAQIIKIVDKREEILAAIPDDGLRQVMRSRIDYLEGRLPKTPEVRTTWTERAKKRQAEPGITQETAARVKQSRINGTVVKGDRDLVEDNNLLVWQEKNKAGKEVTRVNLKVTQRGSEALQRRLVDLGVDLGDMKQAVDPYFDSIKLGAKTIAHHASDGQYNQSTLNALMQTKTTIEAKLAQLPGATPLAAGEKQMLLHYKDAIEKILEAKAKKQVPPMVSQYIQPVTKQKAPGAGIIHRKENINFRLTRIKNGFAEEVAQSQSVGAGSANQIVLSLQDGTQVKFIPRGSATGHSQGLALHGTVEVTVEKEVTTEVLQEIMQNLKSLGIDMGPPTKEYEELLYLHRSIYLRNDHTIDAYRKIWEATDLTDAQKVEKIKEWAGKKYGVDFKRIEYDPAGKTMTGFGDGFRYWQRWDLTPAQIESEMKGYVLSHNITSGTRTSDVLDAMLQSGGEATSTVGRIRKGVSVGDTGGMSSSTDVGTGGASYFFTRITPETSKRGALNFKIRCLSRQDTISYGYDKFGAIGDVAERKATVAQYKSIASGSSNETIFKHGLSLLDDLDFVYAKTEAEKREIVAVFKKNKVTHMNDGRKVEDIVRVHK